MKGKCKVRLKVKSLNLQWIRHKPDFLHWSRHLCQIIFLLQYPGLFMICFSQIKFLFQKIVLHETAQRTNGFLFLLFLFIFFMNVVFGRLFCSYQCTFGAMLEAWHAMITHFYKPQFHLKESMDHRLCYLKYIVLVFTVPIFLMFGIHRLDTFSPFQAFEHLTEYPDIIIQYNIGLVMLIFILFGEVFIEKFFCKYLCPIGAFWSITSVLSPFRIKFRKQERFMAFAPIRGKLYGDSESDHLKIPDCPMRIDNCKSQYLNECIGCFHCMNGTPISDSNWGFAGKRLKNPKIPLVLFLSLSLVLGATAYFPTELQHQTQQKSQSEVLQEAVKDHRVLSGSFKDGTYIGVGNGDRGEIEVKVTIKKNQIASIVVEKNQESALYAKKPMNELILTMIQNQNSDVDTVSGATLSSSGLIQAVEDALNSAKIQLNY